MTAPVERDHRVLKSLLGAWALEACSAEETAAVERHLGECGGCAEEAVRLREAVGLLHPEESLDLDPMLRAQVLDGCMGRRPPRVPVPGWAAPYDAEASRLDALLRDMAEYEWRTPVTLRWFDGRGPARRETTVGGAVAHLLAEDGLVARALDMPDPLAAAGADRAPLDGGTDGGTPVSSAPTDDAAGRGGTDSGTAAGEGGPAEGGGADGPAADEGGSPAVRRDRDRVRDRHPDRNRGRDPDRDPDRDRDRDRDRDAAAASAIAGPGARTEAYWRADCDLLHTAAAREPWREQGREMIHRVSFAGGGVGELDVDYGKFTLPVQDAMLDRAFECWKHASDITAAIGYPYTPPQGRHLHLMLDLAARLLPAAIAWRRRTGLAGAPQRLTTAGAPGRAVRLEVEGEGGGDWYIALDSPAAKAGADDAVAQVTLDEEEFCQLLAGHVPPLEALAGQVGDPEAVRDVLYAAASLSRL